MENDKLLALLFLKVEEIGEDNYFDVEPSMSQNRKLKISTFKVDVKGKKIGKKFIEIVLEQACYFMVDEIYITLFDNADEKRSLIKYLEKYGFKYFGLKNKKELVYVKKLK